MNIQKLSNQNYRRLALSKYASKTEKAGRYKDHSGIEQIIFNDIQKKLSISTKDKVLDIGCGCGPLTDILVKMAIKKNFCLTLCDIPEVIGILKKKFKKNKNLKFIESEFQKTSFKSKYDKILCYSVMQCVSNPKNFFRKILTISKFNSKILVGDLPNINKKYRFLKSDFGNHFESKRLKKKVNKPKNFKLFREQTNQNLKINDQLILFMLDYTRKQNRDCYILKQSTKLPFSYTREDLLIL